MDKSKFKIVVWLKDDYTESDEFECSSSLTKEQISEEVNKKYKMWYYYDIWHINGKK